MKTPSVSPLAVLGGCGSVRGAIWAEEGLVSTEVLGAGVEEPNAGEVDLGVRENCSSDA